MVDAQTGQIVTASQYAHNFLDHDFSKRWLFTLSTFLIGTPTLPFSLRCRHTFAYCCDRGRLPHSCHACDPLHLSPQALGATTTTKFSSYFAPCPSVSCGFLFDCSGTFTLSACDVRPIFLLSIACYCQRKRLISLSWTSHPRQTLWNSTKHATNHQPPKVKQHRHDHTSAKRINCNTPQVPHPVFGLFAHSTTHGSAMVMSPQRN